MQRGPGRHAVLSNTSIINRGWRFLRSPSPVRAATNGAAKKNPPKKNCLIVPPAPGESESATRQPPLSIFLYL